MKSAMLHGTVVAAALTVVAAGEANADYRVLYSFCRQTNCADRGYPYSTPVADAAGTTFSGGANGGGVVYEYTP